MTFMHISDAALLGLATSTLNAAMSGLAI